MAGLLELGDWRRVADEEEVEEGLAYPLTARDLVELRTLFDAFAERSGEGEVKGVTAASLRAMAEKALGVRMPLEKCSEAISLWCDTESMDFEAFLMFYAAKLKGESSAEELRGVFRMLKTDPRNNHVPASAVANAVRELSGVGEKRVARMFRDAFPGRDYKELMASGSLTFDEFAAFMR